MGTCAGWLLDAEEKKKKKEKSTRDMKVGGYNRTFLTLVMLKAGETILSLEGKGNIKGGHGSKEYFIW